MFRQTVWGQCKIKASLIEFDWSFMTKKCHLLGKTVGNSGSTGPGSKHCTCRDEVERV